MGMKRDGTRDCEDPKVHPFCHTKGAALKILFSVERFYNSEDFGPERRLPRFFDG